MNKINTADGLNAAFDAKSADQVPVMNLIYNHANPYQKLIYADPDAPVSLLPGRKPLIGSVSKLSERERPRLLHIHWDDRMFNQSASEEDNKGIADVILADLEAYKALGGKIIWTVHNRIPHTLRDATTFAWARQRLADLSDLIHVHAAHAAYHIVETYDVPAERVVIVPHPSYLGAYEDEALTLKRPIATGDTQFLHFGYFRGNKGSMDVLNTARILSGRRADGWQLTFSGKARGRELKVLGWYNDIPNANLSGEAIADDEIPALFGKSHFYLAPFNDLFTSGTVMLALSYGLPVIGPNTPEMRETTPKACHDMLYTNDDNPRRLMQWMLNAMDMPKEELAHKRQACFEFAQSRSPLAMSKILGRAIGSLAD